MKCLIFYDFLLKNPAIFGIHIGHYPIDYDRHEVILQEWLPLQLPMGWKRKSYTKFWKNLGYQGSWTSNSEQSVDGSTYSSAFQPKFDCKVKICTNYFMQCVYVSFSIDIHIFFILASNDNVFQMRTLNWPLFQNGRPNYS